MTLSTPRAAVNGLDTRCLPCDFASLARNLTKVPAERITRPMRSNVRTETSRLAVAPLAAATPASGSPPASPAIGVGDSPHRVLAHGGEARSRRLSPPPSFAAPDARAATWRPPMPFEIVTSHARRPHAPHRRIVGLACAIVRLGARDASTGHRGVSNALELAPMYGSGS
jgi:hypothetical protein